MKKLILSVFILLTIATQGFSQETTSNSRFVGVFQNCLIHCTTIKIKSDFTFILMVKGDIFDETREGKWEVINTNKIHLTAPGEESKTDEVKFRKEDGTLVEFSLETPEIQPIDMFLLFKKKKLILIDENGKSWDGFKRLTAQKAEVLFPDEENN